MTDAKEPSRPLPPLRDVIEAHGLAAKKTLGQHFLLDLNITRKIVRLAGVNASDAALEVGPGPGGLTRAILETGARLTAIERDNRCEPLLRELSAAFDDRLSIVLEDALAADERAHVSAPVKILSNLPYNISTPLLIKWIKANHQDAAPLWSVMALMFQKEVADRILAAPGGKAYGRLSIIAQAGARPERGFDLPARAFTPPPKVDSTVVIFHPRHADRDGLARLEAIAKAAFAQRRKMLRASMKSLWGAQAEDRLRGADIDPGARAEDLTVNDYKRLANFQGHDG
ncbi:MAG: 16S rRNA (adenine(1518)-N(6)/adenine(1519)-N(6))-dimethyltransferase RsmA [Pseudomonadota bacterium]